MSARKPKLQYYWTRERGHPGLPPGHVVNWRLVGANGEIMCQSTQGFRDKADARRSVFDVVDALVGAWVEVGTGGLFAREVGPGRKP